VTATLTAGTHTISKADVAYLFLIIIDLDDSGSSSSAGVESSSSSEDRTVISTKMTHLPAGIFFNRGTSRLTIGSASVNRVDIISIQGEKILHSANGQSEFSLAKMPSGIYIVRAITAEGTFSMKIFKD
jgi:pectate lyase